MTASPAPEVLTIVEIFDGERYVVPLYQRAYAWTEAEIDTLLADVRLSRLTPDTDYYIGSLVVDTGGDADDRIHEVVDGQQRLTTLTILFAVARAALREVGPSAGMSVSDLPVPRLRFEGRPQAEEDLRALLAAGDDGVGLARSRLTDVIEGLSVAGIRSAATRMHAALVRGLGANPKEKGPNPEEQGEVVFETEDLRHLLTRVRLLRTALPPRTDLNHYFEIMNTRGEQLAKHEVLKAQLMAELPREEHSTFARVWDASAVLDRHLQLQFTTRERDRLFGRDWCELQCEDFAGLHTLLTHGTEEGDGGGTGGSRARTLADVLAGDVRAESAAVQTSTDEDDDGTYGSIIDFPNFLLHVLKVMSVNDQDERPRQRWGEDTDPVRLDDKDLLRQFAEARKRAECGGCDAAEFSRRFAFRLLKLRLLFDTYVIRTRATLAGTPDEENWVLEQAYRQGNGRGRTRRLSTRASFARDDADRVRALQAMFQVTDTRRTFKYFLFRILRWLDEQGGDPEEMSDMLESLGAERLSQYDFDAVAHAGTSVPNFLFNVLDYILWSAHLESAIQWSAHRKSAADRILNLLAQEERTALDQGAPKFRFRYRTSVEHFYPVQPSPGHERLPIEQADHFGNLCVMTRTENSRRNNLMPLPKVGQFTAEDQSLKFSLMAALAKASKTLDVEVGGWTRKRMHDHGERMLNVLRTWEKEIERRRTDRS
ncbi:DUF262 domain-containing protein [Brachybacterium sp. EF45031]|uniref:DUF262 domain-containing protein n=1 Tax=Brachybacterium sillae TaxID=2810536 RepID=UPI00217D825F|nr:DUF262 domain-containing protein [Brachybacterium sillae]MCS6710688.1 DUF262 domain-containing protein [Brachybacterium sillae]